MLLENEDYIEQIDRLVDDSPKSRARDYRLSPEYENAIISLVQILMIFHLTKMSMSLAIVCITKDRSTYFSTALCCCIFEVCSFQRIYRVSLTFKPAWVIGLIISATNQKTLFRSMWLNALIIILSSINFIINTIGATNKTEIMVVSHSKISHSSMSIYIMNSVFSGLGLFSSLYLFAMFYELYMIGVKRAKNKVTLIPRRRNWYITFTPEAARKWPEPERLERIYLR